MIVDASIFAVLGELDEDAEVSPSRLGLSDVSQFAELTPELVRRSSLAIADATRVRACACGDRLDVRIDVDGESCGICGAAITKRRRA